MIDHVDNMRRLLNHHDPYVAKQGRQMAKESPNPAIRALLTNSHAVTSSLSGMTVQGRAGRAAKLASSKDVSRRGVGTSKASRPGDPFDFTHLIPTTIPEPDPLPSPNPDREQARAAAILALPEAKRHPAAAARLAGSKGVSVNAARNVLATIEPAVARRVNAAEGPAVALLMHVRGLIDGKTHTAAPRGRELTRHDRANAAGCRRLEAEA